MIQRKRISDAFIFLSACIRGYLGRRRYRLIRRQIPHVIIVFLKSVNGMRGSTAGFFHSTPRPYVIINTLKTSKKPGTTDEQCVATTRSKVASTSADVSTWDEELQICMRGEGHLALTVMSSQSVTNEAFLGQVLVDLRKCPQLYEKKPLVFTQPCADLSSKVYGIDGAIGPIQNSPYRVEKSALTFSLHVPPIQQNISGFFWEESVSFFTGVISHNKLWVILLYENLYLYNAPAGREQELINTISCKNISRLTDTASTHPLKKSLQGAAKVDAIKIDFINGDASLTLTWGDDSAEYRGLWKCILGFYARDAMFSSSKSQI